MTDLRAGAALIEAVIAGVLLSIVAATGATLLRTQSRIAHDVTVRSERNDASRSALLTLQAELKHIEPRADLRAVSRDSIAGRIFRGTAIVCGSRDSLTYARYRGLRLPDATKDSALEIGVERPIAIRSVAPIPARCVGAGNEQTLALNLGSPASSGSIWLVFENGSYHLSDNALRYRRGHESRQPLTNEVIDVRGSSFSAAGDSVIRAIEVVLRDRRTRAVARATIGLGNAQ